MRPVRALLPLLFCLSALWLAAVPAVGGESQQVFAHLFTVPTVLPGGADAAEQTAALRTWLAETFGGFTRLGAGEGGWKNEEGHLETEANTTYLVTAPRDVSKEIAARLTRDFGVRIPYVLVFPAAVSAK
jgi:hypothetical protein